MCNAQVVKIVLSLCCHVKITSLILICKYEICIDSCQIKLLFMTFFTGLWDISFLSVSLYPDTFQDPITVYQFLKDSDALRCYFGTCHDFLQVLLRRLSVCLNNSSIRDLITHNDLGTPLRLLCLLVE